MNWPGDFVNKVVCGDCLEATRWIPDGALDALVTDPPFVFAGGISNGRTSIASNQFFLHWWRDVCGKIERVMKKEGEGFWWCDWRSATTLAAGFHRDQRYTWRVAQMLYHYREMIGMGRPFRGTVDMISYLRGPKSKGARIPSNTENLLSKYWYYGKHPHHPAEKSVDIAMQLIRWCSDEGDLIFDPFAGSGTTAVAAIRTGRRFVCIDTEEAYCEVANERIAEAMSELLLV